MKEKFNLIVIGSGAAGGYAAGLCKKQGLHVAVIDELPFGGTCPLRGCDPKKMLRRGAEIIDAASSFEGKGISRGNLRINWTDLINYKRTWTVPFPKRYEKSLKERGIHLFSGKAFFTSQRTVQVGHDELEADFFLIATGAKPMSLPILGAEHMMSSSDFMELDQLPEQVLFVGGGFISFEFAHMAVRTGSKIIVLDLFERPLPAFEPDLVDALVEHSKKLGIDFYAKTVVESISKLEKGFLVTAKVDGKEQKFQADLIVHGAGRVPAIDDLNLKKAEVKTTKRGIEVNQYLQSSTNPAVYAAGDVASTPGFPLTPVGSIEGEIVAKNIIEGNKYQANYNGIPAAVYTIPALTRVGLLESEAKEKGLSYSVIFNDMKDWYTSKRVGSSLSLAKVLIDNQSSQILGAHLIGPDSVELTNIFALAIRVGIKTEDLKHFVAVYPSGAADLEYLI